MLTKVVVPMAKRLCAHNVGATTQAVRLSHHGDFKPQHMDDLPVPQGSWEDFNRKRQAKYNLHLAFGIGFALFSLGVAKASGLFFLNFSPPEKPASH